MKKSKFTPLCFLLSGSILFSSCIGSFKLFNNLKEWNQGVSDKFVNELIFLAFHIVPIYPIAYLADVLVLNSIEFWSGRNPVSSIGDQKEIKGEDGANYTVTTTADGYRIAKEGENVSLDLVYDKKDRTWNAVSGNERYELVQMNEDGTAITFWRSLFVTVFFLPMTRTSSLSLTLFSSPSTYVCFTFSPVFLYPLIML